MRHIAPILKTVLEQGQLRRGVANYTVLSRWEEVVGKTLAGMTRPLRIQGDCLWVYVESAALLHQLTYLTPRLHQRIREEAPGATIRRIRFTQNPEG